MKLTIAYITSRKEPKIEWFFDSLAKQVTDDDIKVEIIDALSGRNGRPLNFNGHGKIQYEVSLPKPTIWQGEYRITKEDWWAKSNAMNTAICLCTTEFIAFVDDRCVLTPIWLQCVKDAIAGNYAVCGSYVKCAHMKVENGEIIDSGEFLGEDDRHQVGYPIPTKDWYGGSCALPLEWCLEVNGFPEACDSLGSEDSMFGMLLRNNNFPMKYDSRMKIIEDRTPSEIGGALKRADKNPHLGRQAKSWMLVRMFHDKKTSQNEFDIRNVRDRVLLNGESLSGIPPVGSHFDFYDGQPISEME